MTARTLAPLVAAVLAHAAAAQTVLHTFDEPEAGAGAGVAVAIWDDLNGDGRLEWVVGAHQQDSTGGVDAGRVTVLSGLDHAVLQTFDGGAPGARFGCALANVGDVNLDGVEDLAIGASGAREVRVVSGADYSTLWTVSEPGLGDFGFSVAAAGRVDADAVGDVVVGAPAAGSNNGAVAVYSGGSGASLFGYSGSGFGRLGWSVSSAGDTNGDGFGDVIAGAPFTYNDAVNQGAAVVLGGPSGGVLATYAPTGSNQRGMEFGFSVCPMDDLDGDGVQDYAIGSRWYGAFHFIDYCWVGVFSGATQAELWRAEGSFDGWFGYSIANAGDLDLDGHEDLLVGDPNYLRVYAFSPARDVELFRFQESPPGGLGTALAGGRDVDGDGWMDGVQGSAYDAIYNYGSGYAQLFTYGCWPDAVYSYCGAVTNSTGMRARMHWQNSTSITNNDLRLSADRCPANKPGLFFYGESAASSLVGDGVLCAAGNLQRLPVVSTGSTGTPSTTVDFANPPTPAGQIQAGDTRYFSFWFRDPAGGPAGFNFANGLRATFCP